jgi:CRP/FNR family cyclic AMP-dependent transcriptional regulator
MNDKNKALSLAAFLPSENLVGRVVELNPEQAFFTQGDQADSVFILKEGRAKLAVVSPKGKQAVITILSPGDFFGEESLALAPGTRLSTASALNACSAIKMTREEMMRMVREQPDFCFQILSVLAERGLCTQADLVDKIFNTSEKRLARTLLLMADSFKPDDPQPLILPITQETLAEMVGTTRSRVSYFMNSFRNRGLIEYKDRIRVHKPRLKAVLADQFAEI